MVVLFSVKYYYYYYCMAIISFFAIIAMTLLFSYYTYRHHSLSLHIRYHIYILLKLDCCQIKTVSLSVTRSGSLHNVFVKY